MLMKKVADMCIRIFFPEGAAADRCWPFLSTLRELAGEDLLLKIMFWDSEE